VRAPPDLSDLSDQDVVALARLGREDAYGELLRRFQRPVHKMIYHMVHDHALAEDLTQETFVKLLDELDKYRPELKLSSWIFKIANNIAIDHFRLERLETVPLDDAPDDSTPRKVRGGATPITVLSDSTPEARALGPAIHEAIAQLKEQYRQCVMLRDIEGRSYEDIAEILNLPVGTVASYIHRARALLKGKLGPLRSSQAPPPPGPRGRA